MAIDLTKAGYVYVMSNPAFPTLVKVGFTRRSPFERLNEGNGTFVPDDYKMEFYDLLEDSEMGEKMIHSRLDEVRHNPNKEFFKLSVDEAIFAIKQAQRDIRERVFSSTDRKFPMKNREGKRSYVVTHEYSNPKAVEMIQLLVNDKTKKGLNSKDFATKLKISEKGVLLIVRFFENSGYKVLYTQELEKQSLNIRLHLAFKETEFKLLAEKYPKLDFSKIDFSKR